MCRRVSDRLEAMAFPPKLIAIDIDGTLLPSAGTVISRGNCRALREAEAAGIQVVIATGRRQAYASPLIGPVGLRSDTVMITSNGTITRTLGGEPMDRFFLPVETALELCPVLRRFGGTPIFTFDREGPGELVLESKAQVQFRIAAWIEANRRWIAEISPLERAFDGGEAPVQGMVCGTVAGMRQSEEWLGKSELGRRIEMHRTEYPARDLAILDILPPGCSKGAALGRLGESRGIAPEEMMAIGDNFNDREMLEFVGHPVVMANAAPDLLQTARERGWRVAPSNDEDGVARILGEVMESAAEGSAVQSAGEIAG